MDTIYSVHHLHIWRTHPLCREYLGPSRSLIRFKRKLEPRANCELSSHYTRDSPSKGPAGRRSSLLGWTRNAEESCPDTAESGEAYNVEQLCVKSQSAVSQALTLHQTIVIY